MPSFHNMDWNVLFKISLRLSVRTETRRLRTCLEYFASIDRNAELTAVPVLDRSGTICRCLVKVCITLNRYLYLSLCLLRDCISIRSHSQTSIKFVTVYRFLGNILRIGLCNVYAFCVNSHASNDRLDIDFEAVANFAAVEKAEGRDGV